MYAAKYSSVKPRTPVRRGIGFSLCSYDLGRKLKLNSLSALVSSEGIRIFHYFITPLLFIFISNSSGVFGHSSLNNRENARSASNFPPVWHVGQ